jgi:hypothetical protein
VGNKELISIVAGIVYAIKTRDQRLRDIGTDVSMHSTVRKEVSDAVNIAKAIVEDSSHT